MNNLIRAIILLSFGIMIYSGLKGYELTTDYAMIVFVISTITSVFVKDK